MESYIKLSTLNDFIFCPKSIFYHELYDSYEKKLYQEEVQIAGTIAHESIDTAKYSSRKNVLQGLSVYSEKLWIAGKIDLFFIWEKKLVERKNKVHVDQNGKPKIYLGYRYQLWGQMYCLEEMGYSVAKIELYSMQDNKTYTIRRPNIQQEQKFLKMLESYRAFNVLQKDWSQNTKKCRKCIYRELCDYYIWEIYPQLSLFSED